MGFYILNKGGEHLQLLFIDDDTSLQELITKRLKTEGYYVDSCFDGQSGYEHASCFKYDCIILDIVLPKLNGLEVLRNLRGDGNNSNIILLTSKSGVDDCVNGLNTGADDYLAKPFQYKELLARIHAVTRRPTEYKDNILSFEDLTMNLDNYTVTRAGDCITLTRTEYFLLEYLLRNSGHVLTRAQILDRVWKNNFDYESNVIDVAIRFLRNKIDKPYEKKLIQTVRGFGYSLRLE